MSTESTNAAPAEAAPAAGFAPQAGIGTPLAVGGFGFAVLMLGFPTAGLIPPGAAAIFAAVAFGTGAFGLGIGGLYELRANNVFGGTFALAYSAFLLTTAIMLRFYAEPMGADFAPAFGTWLLLWFVFTVGLSWAAWHVNMPAFLAFALLALAYLLLGLAQFTGSAGLALAGGWVLILDGIVALYLSWALAVTPIVGDRIPLWPHPYGR
jgi:succinate-acetate transporter protein